MNWIRSSACRAIVRLWAVPAAGQDSLLPIIDMHLHAHRLSDYGGGMPVCTNEHGVSFPGVDPTKPITLDLLIECPSPLPPASSDAEVMQQSLAMLRRYNIWAVTTGDVAWVSEWRRAEPRRISPAHSFAGQNAPTPAEFRRLHSEGKVAVLAEIGAQYQGRSLADSMYEPYFALAEELDLPVGVHLGEGPPGAVYLGEISYRARLTSPLQLEEVLVRHPRLRLYVMHYGSPLVDEMIALLYSHPQVYVDIAQNNWGFPRAHFYSQLERLVNAGFAKRIMWGSDQMIWPETIRVARETLESAPFLTAEQKRDIFYNNAARFLRLSPETIARHHGKAP
jgi:predicted TIM-barrel fold metal-dependent hydrolase